MSDYILAIEAAAGLLEPDEWQDNEEYLRGMCELIARIWGAPCMDTGEAAELARRNIAFFLGEDS